MEKVYFTVEGLSCSHCENAVKTALMALPGVSEVSVRLADKSVSVAYEASAVTVDAMRGAIEEQGYEVVS